MPIIAIVLMSFAGSFIVREVRTQNAPLPAPKNLSVAVVEEVPLPAPKLHPVTVERITSE